MTHRWIAAAVLAAECIVPMAQPAFETKDSPASVFSDRTSAGATAMPLAAPNGLGPQASAPYRRFVINRPAAQDTVRTPTGEFGVSASVSPPLRSSDRIHVRLDGNLVPNVYRGTNLRISESDWQAAASSPEGEHRIQLAIVDADGKPWIETEAVSFYVHRTAMGGERR